MKNITLFFIIFFNFIGTSFATVVDNSLILSTPPRMIDKTSTSATLEWDKVNNAGGYIVVYSKIAVASSSNPNAIYDNETGKISSTGTIISNLEPNTKYYFAVVPLDKEDKQGNYFSSEISIITDISNTPTISDTIEKDTIPEYYQSEFAKKENKGNFEGYFILIGLMLLSFFIYKWITNFNKEFKTTGDLPDDKNESNFGKINKSIIKQINEYKNLGTYHIRKKGFIETTKFYLGIKGRITGIQLLVSNINIFTILLMLGILTNAVGNLFKINENPSNNYFVFVYVLMLIYGNFYNNIKRWHDLNYSAWATFFSLIPLVNVLLIFIPGTKGDNKYGPDPRD